jgi:adenylate cyclase
VIGTHKFGYDVWGDTVNTASRMEKYGEVGRVHVSAATRALLGDAYRFESRGTIEVKGKGKMETFFLEPLS